MVIRDFSSKLVFLDTAPLIYFIEGNSAYQTALQTLFDLNERGKFSFITSTITLLEVLVKPLSTGRNSIAKQYRDILTSAQGIELVDVNIGIAERAAQLRGKYNLRTPDAIQLATAIEVGANYFLTNDEKLRHVNEVTIVTVGEL